MRIATSEGLLSWTYVLRDAPKARTLATVEMKSLASAGTIRIGDVEYRFRQTDWTGKAVVLTFEGIELARATRPSVWTQKMQIRFAEDGLPGAPLKLRPLSAFQIGFHVEDAAGGRVGRITRKGMFRSRFHLDLPASMPLVTQGFLVALAMLDLRRRQSS